MVLTNFEQWEKEKLDMYIKMLTDLQPNEIIAIAATALIYIDGLKIKNMIYEVIQARKNPEFKKDK